LNNGKIKSTALTESIVMHNSWLALAVTLFVFATALYPSAESAISNTSTINHFEISLDETPGNWTLQPNVTANVDLPGTVICELYAQVRTVIIDIFIDLVEWAGVINPSTFSFRGTGIFEEPFNINISIPPLSEGIYQDTLTLTATIHQQPGGVVMSTSPINAALGIDVRNETNDDRIVEDYTDWGSSTSSGFLTLSVLVLAIFVAVIIVIRRKGNGFKGLNKFRKS
jgi:hypothetical protein